MARKAWNHRKCAEHRKVEGYTRVCVLRGQDGDATERFASAMHRLAVAFRRTAVFQKPPVRKRGSMHDGCGGHFDFPGFGKVCYGVHGMSADRLRSAEYEMREFAKEIGKILGASNSPYARFWYSKFWR